MAGQWAYVESTGETPLSLEWNSGDALLGAGWVVGERVDGTPIIEPLELGEISDPTEPQVPLSAALTGNMPSRTEAHLAWVADDNSDRPPITSWQAEVRSSTDDGVSFTAYAATTGSPFSAATTTADFASLSVGTPEVMREYRVRAINVDGNGEWSNVQRLQWATVLPQRPTVPTNFRDLGATTTTHDVAWNVTPDGTVDKYGIFVGQTAALDPTTPLRDNIDPGLLAVTLTGLTPGTTYTNVNVRRHNAQGWSPASNRIDLLQPSETAPPSLMLTGCSSSPNDHGGTEAWDGWRVYTENEMLQRANATGMNRPIYLAYSSDGNPLTGSYNSIRQSVLDDLNMFYYTGSATSQTHSARWGIVMYRSNGNENSDKGMLATNNAANLALWMDSMRAIYDACHFIDPTTGQRRFPDAYAGSNPTQEHERLGLVAWWLEPSARYHDFVMWSMYPPGRGVNDVNLSRNPRWDWPTFLESQRQNRQQGFLIRCFYRTKQAENRARDDTGDRTRRLIIGCGETGMASDPDDRATRPYYATHALIGSMFVLAQQYALAMDFVCWWDNQTADTKPHNVLTDEPPSSDHLAQGSGGAAGNNSTATNPSTYAAWVNWRNYDHRRGGTHPAQWAGKPGNIDNQTGTPI